MCETFKWIKLLVVELLKDGLQISVKIIFGQNDCERRKSFSKYVKNANMCPSFVNWNLDIFKHSPDVLTCNKMKEPQSSEFRNVLTLFAVIDRSKGRFRVFLSPFVAF